MAVRLIGFKAGAIMRFQNFLGIIGDENNLARKHINKFI